MPREGKEIMTKLEQELIDQFIRAVDAVDELMLHEYPGINYDGWKSLHVSKIDTAKIIDQAVKVHGYSAGEIASEILDALVDLSREYDTVFAQQKTEIASLKLQLEAATRQPDTAGGGHWDGLPPRSYQPDIPEKDGEGES